MLTIQAQKINIEKIDDTGAGRLEFLKTCIILLLILYISDITEKMENIVMQYYRNEEMENIEAFYALPFDSKADVILFEADINGTKLFRVIREQKGVDYDYTNAKEFVKLPTIGNETKPDIFKIRLGQLAPGVEVKIQLKYVTKLFPPETKASSCFCPEIKTCNDTLSISSQPGKPPISKGDVDNFFATEDSPMEECDVDDDGLIPWSERPWGESGRIWGDFGRPWGMIRRPWGQYPFK